MTKTDIDTIIKAICPNDEDFENPIISPAYLKKELEALALEQEPNDDCVRREDVITIIARKHLCKDKSDFDKCVHTIAKQVKALPCVRPEMRTGEWKIGGYNDDFYVCDCGFAYVGLLQKYNYCPHCGARMDGDMYLEDE